MDQRRQSSNPKEQRIILFLAAVSLGACAIWVRNRSTLHGPGLAEPPRAHLGGHGGPSVCIWRAAGKPPPHRPPSWPCPRSSSSPACLFHRPCTSRACRPCIWWTATASSTRAGRPPRPHCFLPPQDSIDADSVVHPESWMYLLHHPARSFKPGWTIISLFAAIFFVYLGLEVGTSSTTPLCPIFSHMLASLPPPKNDHRDMVSAPCPV